VTLGTLAAYADNCSQNGAFQPYGSPDTNYSPLGPAVVGNPITTYCSSLYSAPLVSGPYYAQSTPDRPSFIAASGQQYMDTINWEVNPFTGSTSPVFFDGGDGQAMGGDFPNPPYGGGVNGTGYSFGSVPSTSGFPNEGANQMGLTVTNSFGTLPNNPSGGTNQNLFTGTTNGLALALGWDTSTTGTIYDDSLMDSTNHRCYTGGTSNPGGTPDNPNYDPDPACWTTVGPNRGADITGVGFDIQLTQTNQFDETVFAPFSVTFAIYGATPGCSPNGFDAMIGNPSPPQVQCYDYQQAGMTDTQGDSATNEFCPDNDPTCTDYNSSNVQLLGYVTVDSNAGGPAFFGFTTNDPYGVGEVVMIGNSFGQSENSDVNFAINQVTLLTQNNTTPEPTTLLLFGSGLLVAARRLRKKATVKA
jgi:hypothetical protein